MKIAELVALKPLTPEKSRIRSLKVTVDNAKTALKREQERQQNQRKQKSLQRL